LGFSGLALCRQIELEEFLAFFARPKMDNNDFELMCSDMLDAS